ncbi:hypothetical protein QBC35DRAFT_503098 [Podospora australis]|uniref:Uncharacterized protein n=1 Tax=Podospora australis TaxID=1536484 RepID=A0AAN6WPQ0_9PEZI|nr:hypothetical protein QBC35DRAFT_503098 [Podospora australis]
MADRAERADRDRVDRDRVDRDKTARTDRGDRDRTDRDRTDRDRTDRDRSDRRTPPDGRRPEEKTRYDYDQISRVGGKDSSASRYDYDQSVSRAGGKDSTSGPRYDYDQPTSRAGPGGGKDSTSAPRYEYDQAPGPAPYTTTAGPVPATKTRSDADIGFAPVPVLTDAGYRPPPGPDHYASYPPPGTELPYGRPPPPGQSASYPLPPQSSGISSYPPPGPPGGPQVTGANGTYYSNHYQPPEVLAGPAAIAGAAAAGSVVGGSMHGSMHHINPMPLPSPGGPLPLAVQQNQVGSYYGYQSPPLKMLHSRTESSVREYVSLQRQRNMVLKKGTQSELVAVENRLRSQAASALADLRVLRNEINEIVISAEGQRWRRWIMGGIFASFIPLVKKLFKPPREGPISGRKRPAGVSRTEYAFRKSKSLVDRILSWNKRPGIATVAFFVFAVLYIFTNEVSLRVSRTIAKRLRRLTAKVESGEGDINEDDLKALQGWRWRVLMFLD